MTESSSITALLGPTNTGKTHRATERMLDHDTGVIGLPLRLLAREVYDRVTARVGEGRVALVTGEEKRVPRRPDYWVCTVEAMPVDREVDFVAVDEVQLAAHPQRGHVFTDRILRARGRRETWFLGSDSMREVFESLCPAAKVTSHPRLSRLSHAEAVTLGRVPARSAVVAFSLEQVYALAERLRAAMGGVAVVLGALSPRTRNAQVAMFQSGEVDHLVATDAIGMGLNLDVRHVAFASLRKFDGRSVRDLDPAEVAQIAGRAGRHTQDGTFGAVSPLTFSRELVELIEQHRAAPVRRVQWRNPELDFSSPDALGDSLRAPPRMRCLVRASAADDESALAALLARPAVRARLGDASRVQLLWRVCSVPDFRKLLFEAHADDLAALFEALADRGALSDAWLDARVAPLDDTDGDVDALVARVAAVRTWTYVAHQADWVARADVWRDRTHALEDRLSDALHTALVRRFVEHRAPPRAGSAAPRPRRSAARRDEHVVSPTHPFAALREMRAAMTPRDDSAQQVSRRHVEALIEAPYARFTLDAVGRICDGDTALARLAPGGSITLPDVELLHPDALGGGDRARLTRRLAAWTRDFVAELFGPLRALSGVSPNARGVLYRVEQGLGCAWTHSCAALVADLTDDDRAALADRGVHLGGALVYATALLRGDGASRRRTLATVHYGALREAPTVRGGTVALRPARGASEALYLCMGFPVFAGVAVRADIAERVHAATRGPTAPDPEALSRWLSLSKREAAVVTAAIAGASVSRSNRGP